MRFWLGGAMMAATVISCPCAAETARDVLTQASFNDRDPNDALKRIGIAQALAAAALKRNSDDREAQLMQATALGYRARLDGSRTEAIAARKLFEALVARDPRNPEAQLALGAWHVGAVFRLGRLGGRAILGAQKPLAYAALDKAVALGGDRALFPGLSALLRLELDPGDARARQLAEVAVKAGTQTAIDRIIQRAVSAVLIPLRAGRSDEVKQLAAELLPFGRLRKD
ncbi:hypothetical protein [Sphingomonas sp. GV3]|jgi:hypothetical protein|uniref:hypothetical protein n=1 Tax=Sphingomonas sp. GV3 TaxID=3040671 RepID=UPI00280C07AE|nr:hypothetical protein [Sphingomonas sp. GV3]